MDINHSAEVKSFVDEYPSVVLQAIEGSIRYRAELEEESTTAHDLWATRENAYGKAKQSGHANKRQSTFVWISAWKTPKEQANRPTYQKAGGFVFLRLQSVGQIDFGSKHRRQLFQPVQVLLPWPVSARGTNWFFHSSEGS